MNNQKIIAFVAGKSGGHIIPGMTIAQEYCKQNPHYKILFFSTDTQLDRTVVSFYPFIFRYVPLSLSVFPGKRIQRYPSFILHLVCTFFVSVGTLWRSKPTELVSMGGIISIPVCLAAWLLRIPIKLYSLDAVPGKALSFLVPFSEHIYVCFQESLSFFPAKKAHYKEYPLRFSAVDSFSREQACSHLKLDPQRKTVFILGGSQGSQFINALMLRFIAEHPHVYSTIQVIHQTGVHDSAALKDLYSAYSFPSLVFDYRHDLHVCYAAADIVIARAGAGTLFELAFFKKMSLIIPLEARSTRHQIDNAYSMEKKYPSQFVVFKQPTLEKDARAFNAKILSCLS